MPTGLLGVGSTNASQPEPIPAAPGMHRVRLYFGNRDATVSDGGPEPVLAGYRYRVTLWPISNPAYEVVLKRWPKIDSHPALAGPGWRNETVPEKSSDTSADA